ncbi:hypothetical protein [Psychrobacillus sp. FSL K6-2843]|uniref:hypothetical protein n=1 Tax=Psychrobacillus sp. FSL K6-2843 TaxID=2921549 RepID=UPI003159BFCE
MWRPWMWMGRSVTGNDTVAEMEVSVVKNFGSVACNSESVAVTWTSVAQKVLSVAESMKY